jgi:NADP-dependent 3-hydroxy acid dehydrogenase YdfG
MPQHQPVTQDQAAVLVTGATGGIGTALTASIVDAGQWSTPVPRRCP